MLTLLLPGTVQKATPNLKGFDMDSQINFDQAVVMKNAGYFFCARYIPRDEGDVNNTVLTHAEAIDILNADLALIVIQHVPSPGWSPSSGLGTKYGTYAGNYAQNTIGLLPGVNVWCDLEGVSESTNATDVIEYCQAWYNSISSYGYVPGIYVGYDTGLTSKQLYDLPFQHYWQAFNGPEVEPRGFQLIQKAAINKTVNNLSIDEDCTQNDNMKDALSWLVKAPNIVS